MVTHQRQSFSHCCLKSWVIGLFQAQQARDDLLLESAYHYSDMEIKDMNSEGNVLIRLQVYLFRSDEPQLKQVKAEGVKDRSGPKISPIV